MTKNLDTHISRFKEHIQNKLSNFLSPKLTSVLSNMLAIDFAIRVNGSTEANPHIETCVQNVLDYISYHDNKFDDSFASSTILFSVAIAPPPRDIKSIVSISQLPNKEDVARMCTELCIPQSTLEEKSSMQDALEILLQSEQADALFNFILNDPKSVAEINTKYMKKIDKIRAQIIANEVAMAHINKLHINESSGRNPDTIAALIKDLSSHISNKEYNPKELAALTKMAGLERGG